MTPSERLALAKARAREAAARVEREVLERELRSQAPAEAPPPKRKPRRSRPVDTGRPLPDTDKAAAQQLARDLGVPIRRVS